MMYKSLYPPLRGRDSSRFIQASDRLVPCLGTYSSISFPVLLAPWRAGTHFLRALVYGCHNVFIETFADRIRNSLDFRFAPFRDTDFDLIQSLQISFIAF